MLRVTSSVSRSDSWRAFLGEQVQARELFFLRAELFDHALHGGGDEKEDCRCQAAIGSSRLAPFPIRAAGLFAGGNHHYGEHKEHGGRGAGPERMGRDGRGSAA